MLHLGEKVHPSHQGFANAINAELVSCTKADTKDEVSPHSAASFLQELHMGSKINGYDIVITEGARPLYAAVANKYIRDTSVIYLCAEHRIYQVVENKIDIDSAYTAFKYLLGKYGTPILRQILTKSIDGVIVVSNLMKEYIRRVVGKEIPIKVAHPYIQQPLFDKLGELDPTPESKIVLNVGSSQDYKGTSMLVNAWDKIHTRNPKLELHIVGNGHPKTYESVPGVKVRGFVDDLTQVYSDAGLYVQPSRVDAFPVATLEALRASVPTVVTNSTGTKSEIKRLSGNFISDKSPDKIKKKVNWWFERDIAQRRALCNKSGKIGSKFGPSYRTKLFKYAFENVVSEIR